MSFRVAEHTVSAAVAALGTFTVSYPSGTDAGRYRGAVGHKIVTGGNDVYESPTNFTLSFGATNITVTSVDMVLAAGVKLYVQLEERGENDGDPTTDRTIGNVFPAVPVVINLGAPDTADSNGYVESQDLTAAGVFSVNTTAAAAIAAGALAGTADVARNVVGAWTGTAVLTVTGTDVDGNVMVESSGSGTSLTGKKAFKTVTGVSTSSNITALTVGTGDVIGLPVFVGEASQVIAELQDGVNKDATTALVTLTDSTGDSGTHDDTLADGSTVGAAITDNTTGSAATTWAAGVGVQTVTFPHVISAGTGAVDAVTAYVPGYKFKILGWSFVTDVAGTGSGASRAYNMEIGTTDVGTSPSTCTLTLAGTDTIGKLTAGTAVSGANTGSASDSFSIETPAAGTAFTAGSGTFIVQIQNMDLADAMAGIAAQHNLLRTDSIVQNQNDSDIAQKVIQLVTDTNALKAASGTLVVGDTAAPTATTGDARGTYDAADAANGSRNFELVALLTDPAYRGLTPYAG